MDFVFPKMSGEINEIQAAAAWMRREFPGAESELEDEDVKVQMERARNFGFDCNEDVRAFLLVSWLLGQDFENQFPNASKILLNELMPSHLKASWLLQWCSLLFVAATEE